MDDQTIPVDLETALSRVVVPVVVPPRIDELQDSLTATLDFSSPSGTTAGLIIGVP